jgi:hypothetical protein
MDKRIMASNLNSKKERAPIVILLSKSVEITQSIQSILGGIIEVVTRKRIKSVLKYYKDARCILLDCTDGSALTKLDLEALQDATRLPIIAIFHDNDSNAAKELSLLNIYGSIKYPFDPNAAVGMIIRAIFKSSD